MPKRRPSALADLGQGHRPTLKLRGANAIRRQLTARVRGPAERDERRQDPPMVASQITAKSRMLYLLPLTYRFNDASPRKLRGGLDGAARKAHTETSPRHRARARLRRTN